MALQKSAVYKTIYGTMTEIGPYTEGNPNNVSYSYIDITDESGNSHRVFDVQGDTYRHKDFLASLNKPGMRFDVWVGPDSEGKSSSSMLVAFGIESEAMLVPNLHSETTGVPFLKKSYKKMALYLRMAKCCGWFFVIVGIPLILMLGLGFISIYIGYVILRASNKGPAMLMAQCHELDNLTVLFDKIPNKRIMTP